MTKFYLVSVKTMSEMTQDNGKLKLIKKTESYLVECESIPEAEQIADRICKLTYDDYIIKSVRETSIISILSKDDLKK